MTKKFKLYKRAIIEIIETLCTICLVLESQRGNGINGRHFRLHFNELKNISEKLRGKI